jgi:hypothetical protein
MSKDNIFELMDNYANAFFSNFKLEYTKKDTSIINSNPDYLVQIIKYDSAISDIELNFRMVFYIDKTIADLRIYNRFSTFNGNNLLNFDDYFGKYKMIKDSKFKFFLSNNLETLDAELKQLFEWLTSVTDTQLINILQGKDWVDIPFDWGDYK